MPKGVYVHKSPSIETLKKRSISLSGKKRSIESRKRYSLSKMGEKNPMFGKHHVGFLNNKNKNTSIEMKVEKELIDRNIIYKKNFPLLNIANVDFYLPYYNIVIQCDGCYWHNCLIHRPKCNVGSRNKDEKQDLLFEEEGIEVYRLWEHEIKNPEIKYSGSVTVDQLLKYILNK
jgi:G:T-mismatch repair DNA endonuclease (very short patch repair protein)